MDDRDDGVHSNGLDMKFDNITAETADEYFAEYHPFITRALPNFSNRLVFKGPIEALNYKIIKSICLALKNLSDCLGGAKGKEVVLQQHLAVLHPKDEEYESYLKDAEESLEDLAHAVLRLKKATRGAIKVEWAI